MLVKEERVLLASASDLDPVKSFVVQALQGQAKGESFFYDNVVKQLQDRDDQEMVWKVYISLSSCVSMFTAKPEKYRDLIGAIYKYDWKCDRKVSIALVNLLGHMVSSNVTFLVPIFEMLVHGLLAKDSDLAALAAAGVSSSQQSTNVPTATGGGKTTEEIVAAATAASSSTGKGSTGRRGLPTHPGGPQPQAGKAEAGEQLPPGEDAVFAASLREPYVENLLERFYRIHRTIHSLVHLAPTGLGQLLPILVNRHPHKRFSVGVLTEYTAQLLYICEYVNM